MSHLLAVKLVRTFIEYDQPQAGNPNKAMGHCIQKYSRGRDDHLDIIQHGVPDHLLRPQLNLVKSSERARLCSRDVLGDGTMLLQAEGDGRCQEPY